jgi:hyperosmotically inducible periplasmic protein
MFGCLFRFIRLIVFLIVLALIGGGVYYYTKLHPEKAFWKDGASAVKDKVATLSLAAQVKAALSLRESLKALDIEVSAEKDVVTLRGKVPSGEASKSVEGVASSVPGVRQVVNFLEVDATAGRKAESDGRSIGEKLDDEALELKVRAAFRLDKTLAEAGFEVKVLRRAIQLSSSAATADQKKRALEVARSVEGVAKVEVR